VGEWRVHLAVRGPKRGRVVNEFGARLVLWVVLVLAFAFLALIARKLTGCLCKCGRRARRFDELGPEEKDEILSYFRHAERREPDPKGIFVCDACETVFDDFSGERKSLDCDNVSMCKVCG
jgi:hypothetical protein